MRKIGTLCFHSAVKRWYVRIDGKQQYLTNANATEEEASLAFEKLKSKLGIRDEECRGTNLDKRFPSLVQEYLRNNAHNGVATHQNDRERILNWFLTEFQNATPRTLKPYQIETWVKREWGSAISQQVSCYKKLGAFFNWAIKNMGLVSNPIKQIHKPVAQPRSADCVLSTEEYQTLLNALKEPYKSICAILWHSGCRPNEVLSAEAIHYKPAIHCISRDDNKNMKKGKLRQILLNNTAEVILQQQIEKHPTGLLFPSVTGIGISPSVLTSVLKRVASKIGIKKDVFAYGFRHSFANRHYKNGVPIATIAAWMDDTIQIVEKHYLHSAHKLEDTRDLL